MTEIQSYTLWFDEKNLRTQKKENSLGNWMNYTLWLDEKKLRAYLRTPQKRKLVKWQKSSTTLCNLTRKIYARTCTPTGSGIIYLPDFRRK